MSKVNIKINGVDWELDSDKQKVEIVSDGKINISVLPKKPKVGDEIFIAGLSWKILDITDAGYMCHAITPYGKGRVLDSDSNDWRKSSLRKELNTKLFEKIAEEIGEENIVMFQRDLLSMDGQTEYGTCEDKVSLLTVDEYRKYRKLIPNSDKYWWLITPWSTPCNDCKTAQAVVCPSGGFDWNNCSSDYGVRPVCIFSSTIFESEKE